MSGEDLGQYTSAVIEALGLEKNTAQSKGNEFRAGSNGSLAIDLVKGVWKDWESDEGGGLIDLIARELGIKPAEAWGWMAERGIRAEDPDRRRERPSGPAREARPEPKPKPEPKVEKGPVLNKRVVATYDYTDALGRLVYQVVRYAYEQDGKTEKMFSQRRPDGSGCWINALSGGEFMRWPGRDWYRFREKDFREGMERREFPEGVAHGIYRLPQLQAAIASGQQVFLVEGEKDADTLDGWNVPATTNSGGSKHFQPHLVSEFEGADVVIVPDNDDAGRQGALIKAAMLAPVAKRVRVLDLVQFAPDLPRKGDVTDWAEMGGDADRLYDLVAKVPTWRPASTYKSHFGAVPWSEIDAPGPAHEWLIKGLVTRGELSMLAGPSQSGKSFLAIDISMAVARGVEWMGRKVRKGAVVYQAGESAKGVRRKRLPAYREHYACATEDLPFVLLQRPVDLYSSDADVEALIAEILYWKTQFTDPLELVVIDTFSAATPGANENASEDMSRVLMRCARIGEACQSAVLLVHHMNAAGEKPRGHTSIFANLDSVLVCKKLEDRLDVDRRQIREMKVGKSKDGESDDAFRFVLPAVTIGFDEDGDRVTSCVVAQPNMGLYNEVPEQPKAKGPRLADRPYNYLKAIKSALDEHGEPAPSDVPVPPDVMVVRKKLAAAAYAAIYQGEEEDPVKRDQNLRAARSKLGEKLIAGNYIGQHNSWIWLTPKGAGVFTRSVPPVTNESPPVTNESGPVTNSGGSVTSGDFLADYGDEVPE